MNFTIESSWNQKLNSEFQKPYFINLLSFLKDEYSTQVIYPPGSLIFNAFNYCSFKDLKVVILGQDPYHGYSQAHGLSFSVPCGVKSPPSLQNIFKELHHDLNIAIPESGSLVHWAKQGVLLLNSILTVRKGRPGSHQMRGWEIFSDNVIDLISKERKNIVFILWGNYAHKKGLMINREKHFVVQSAHPSPFSAHRGFFDSKPFSQCNQYLKASGKKSINW